MIELGINGLGLVGPGLADWAQAEALLRDPAGWAPAPTVVPAPARLPATERRRAGTVVKASIAVADQAVAMAGADVGSLATVFTSSTGDPLNCHLLCEALATPERLLSPTRFTNSVHNAPAGYWHIATHSMAPSTSLAAFDASFGAGLLEAAAQCAHGGHPLLFVAADVPYPEPLHAVRPVADSMAVALLLAPPGEAATWVLRAAPCAEPVTPCAHEGLERLRRTIPAARALPLLALLATRSAGRVVVEAADDWRLGLDIRPGPTP